MPGSIVEGCAGRVAITVLMCIVSFGPIVGVARGGSESQPPAPLGNPEGPHPTGDVTVLDEGFEGTLPGSWVIRDDEPRNGEDYWGVTTHRAATGAQSAWSAAVGSQILGREHLWSEEFDGAVLGPEWVVGDSNPASGVDRWDQTSYRASWGSGSAWCAEVGDNRNLGAPNNEVHRYDNDMDASLIRNVSLGGYAFGYLMFDYWWDPATDDDVFRVGYLDDGVWTYNAPFPVYRAAWEYWEMVIPATATAIGFFFVSDWGYVAEGAYVDEVILLGFHGTHVWSEDFEGAFPLPHWTVDDLDPASGRDYWGGTPYRSQEGLRSAWSAEVGDHSILGSPNNVVHTYDTDMSAHMRRTAGLATDRGGYLTYGYWLDSAIFLDYIFPGFSDPVDGWTDWTGHTGRSNGWRSDMLRVPPGATEVGFHFRSLYLAQTEGAYVDAVTLWQDMERENTGVNRNDYHMESWMYHEVDLTGLTAAQMTYSHWLDAGFQDALAVVHSEDGLAWTVANVHGGYSDGWRLANVTLPSTTRYVGFQFHSGGVLRSEGAYVDNVRVIGTAPDLVCGASVSPAVGIEDRTPFAFAGAATGGVPPYAWAWSFGDAGASVSPNPSYAYPIAGTFTPDLVVTDDVGQTCTAGAGTVTVSHRGPLTVTVAPATISVPEGATARFTAVVRDDAGHNLTEMSTIMWTVAPPSCGVLTAAGASATFVTNSDSGGMTCMITASATTGGGLEGAGSVSATVRHAGPLTVELTPTTGVAVDEGGVQVFSALVRDARGHDLTSEVSIAWSVSPASCGSLAPEGMNARFTAASGGGLTACTVTAVATLGEVSGTGTVSVTVRAKVLASSFPTLLAVLVAALLVALLVVVLRRRGRQKPEAEFPQPYAATQTDQVPAPSVPPPDGPNSPPPRP